MRRDLCYFYPCPVNVVYPAYLRAAKERFGKDCNQEPNGKVISFGLNFSFKYNMNGGACTVTFMPYNNGTAVNLRYTIVQAFGARYGRHAEDLTQFADSFIGVKCQPLKLDVNIFINYVNSVQPVQAPAQQIPQPVQQAPQSVQPPVRQASSVPVGGSRFCMYCGNPLGEGARFCAGCGKPVGASAPQKNLCPKCGREFQSDERFCISCGTKNPLT